MEVNCFLFLLWIWNIARTGVSLRTSSYTKYIDIVVFYTLSMIKYYKINTFGLICCRIINGVLFTHVHIKFDDGWWHILYSVYNEIHDIWQYKVMTWPDFFSFWKVFADRFDLNIFQLKWRGNRTFLGLISC